MYRILYGMTSQYCAIFALSAYLCLPYMCAAHEHMHAQHLLPLLPNIYNVTKQHATLLLYIRRCLATWHDVLDM